MKLANACGTASAVALGLVVLAGAGVLARQDEVATRLTQQIDRIMATRTYAVPRFGPARWVPGRAAYTTVEPAAPPDTGMDIVRYDAATGAREVLVPAQPADAAGATKGLAIDDYGWSRGRPPPADLHQHAQGLARQHARRLLGRRSRAGEPVRSGNRADGARLRKLGGDASGGVAAVCQVLARLDARRVCARQRPLRRAPRRWPHHAADRLTAARRRSTARPTGCTRRNSASAMPSAGVRTAAPSPTGSSTAPASRRSR